MNCAASTRLWALVALLTASAIGCGQVSGGVPISGQVAYRGQAIDSGSVTFFPQHGRAVSAVLSSSGEYAVKLAPGNYDVVINIGTELPAAWKEGDPVPAPRIVLPAKYTARVASSLKATVTKRQSDPIDFLLE